MKTYAQTKTSQCMFIVALLNNHKNWRQLKYPTGKQINTLQYIHSIEHRCTGWFSNEKEGIRDKEDSLDELQMY